ncbi:hypothetical protein JCGZ_15908 [Jatropha curcas]|uniref:EamA domain-containing protein n=1 Tax=Jatropha curcas TaxID=180498 RepID=A0A067KZ64_JATCU|nr:protein CLT2, chloroplastic isoform X2 [Jatropha curcas]KDP41501.1 hypothetical protein JCGZ_15908 [Jatropha curcas]
MLLYKTTSLNTLLSRYPTRLHSYNANGPMFFPKNSSLRLSKESKPPFAGINYKLTGGHRSVNHQHSLKIPNFTVRASNENPKPHVAASNNIRKQLILICSAITVTLAVANRVLYKLALVPMKQYPFFLAQFTTFGYVMIYFSILFARYRLGIVSDEMIALPKSRFVVIGILEALGLATGMAAAAMLPGPSIPILSQTFLVWQLSFSALILGRRYSFNQISGCLLVAIGVVVAVASGSNADQMLSGVEFIWPAVMIISSAFQAGASIIKEFIFIDAAKCLKGKSLDIFVVNSFGSGFQALFVLLFLPFLSNLKGIPFAQLPLYLKSGAGCFVNTGGNTPGCDGAPWLPLLYIATNMAFNISLLNLVKISSAVVSSLAVMLSVPISIYVLSLPLPYLPEGTSLSPLFMLGSVILVSGLVLYNVAQPAKQASS